MAVITRSRTKAALPPVEQEEGEEHPKRRKRRAPPSHAGDSDEEIAAAIAAEAATDVGNTVLAAPLPARDVVGIIQRVLNAPFPPLFYEPLQTPSQAKKKQSASSSSSTRSTVAADIGPDRWTLGSTGRLASDIISSLLSSTDSFLQSLAASDRTLIPPPASAVEPITHRKPAFARERGDLDSMYIYGLDAVKSALDSVREEGVDVRWNLDDDASYQRLPPMPTQRTAVALYPSTAWWEGAWIELKAIGGVGFGALYHELRKEQNFPPVQWQPRKSGGVRSRGGAQSGKMLYYDGESDSWQKTTQEMDFVLQAGLDKESNRVGLIVASGGLFCTVFSWTSESEDGTTLHHLATSSMSRLTSPLVAGKLSLRRLFFSLALHGRKDERLSLELDIASSYSLAELPARERLTLRSRNAPKLGKRSSSRGRGGSSAQGSGGGIGGHGGGVGGHSAKAQDNDLFRPQDLFRPSDSNPLLIPTLPSVSTFASSSKPYPSHLDTSAAPSLPANLLVLSVHLGGNDGVTVYTDKQEKFVVKLGPDGDWPEDSSPGELHEELEIYSQIFMQPAAESCLVRWYGSYEGEGFVALVLAKATPCRAWEDIKPLDPVGLLQRFHALGYCHGDLHAGNFAIVDGTLRLLDLGRAYKATEAEREGELLELLELLGVVRSSSPARG
ncbi:hypothetical protein JCM10213_005502 [Rhodosporidiobolus nylandii]